MSTIKVGLASDPLNSTLSATALMRANYMTAAMSRIDSLWVPDHLNALLPRAICSPRYFGMSKLIPSIDAYLEPWTILGHTAGRNRLGKLRLGIGVTDAGRRNPAVTAQSAATLHLMTRGKAVLGIGTGEREGNEPYGVEWTKPVSRFEEAVATIRALWASRGELVSRDSPYFPLRNALFAIPPFRGEWPPIWIASHGPRMLQITGRYADGWFPAFPQQPKDYAARLDSVRAAASNSGRDPMAITPAVQLFVITGPSKGAVEETLESDIAKSFALNISDEVWRSHGVNHPMGKGFTGFQDVIPQTLSEASALSATAQVPTSLLKDTVLTGTPREVIDQAAVWRDHGVRYIVVCNLSFLQPSLKKGLTASVPLARALRGLRRL